jgi:cysteine desulfurase
VIYFDANATTALKPEVLEAMMPWLVENHANPSGSYRMARMARKAIDEAREQVADLITAQPEEVVFTGSGTESVNMALHSLDALAGDGRALVSAIEHSAVLRFMEGRKREVRQVGVDGGGRVDLEDFERWCEGAAYASVMMVNNETGVVQPLGELLEIARRRRLPFHTDAVQAVGKTVVSVREFVVDMLSISAHKFHGPKGVGALYVRSGLDFSALLRGGGQEKGRRSGTENTAGIVGMGKAAELAKKALDEGVGAELGRMRDAFEGKVMSGLAGCVRNGDVVNRLPNTSHLSFEGCDAGGLLILLDQSGVACSAGSACMTGKQKPSHVQLAMGISEERARTSLRFSFSRMSTMGEAMEGAERVIRAVNKLRSVQGGGVGPVVIYGG